MKRSATFSEDRTKRFELIRDWRDEIGAPGTTVLFVGLNPSKAGEKDDDPTVRKMVGFARRWGFGRVVVANLIAVVSTDPLGLPFWNGIDMANRSVLQQWMGEADLIVAAWGQLHKTLARRIALAEHIFMLRRNRPGRVPLHRGNEEWLAAASVADSLHGQADSVGGSPIVGGSPMMNALDIAMARAESLYVIPRITDPLGKHWVQPHRDDIEIDDKFALMSRATFEKLAEYSCLMPTGVYAGKMWSRHDGVYDPRCKPENRRWLLAWFGYHAKPDTCSVNFREILLYDGDLPK